MAPATAIARPIPDATRLVRPKIRQMRVPPFAKISGQKTLWFTGRPSYRDRQRVRFPDVGSELALEPLDDRNQKRLERIAQRAQIEPRHLMGGRHQHVDVALQAAAFE